MNHRGVVWRLFGARNALQARVGGWMASGKLKTREDIVEGLDNFPKAFDMLFTGANNGKLVLKLDPA